MSDEIKQDDTLAFENKKHSKTLTRAALENAALKDKIRKSILDYIDESFINKKDEKTGETYGLSISMAANQIEIKANECSGQGVLLETQDGVTFVSGKESLLINGYETITLEKDWADYSWWETNKDNGLNLLDMTLAVAAEYLAGALPDEKRFEMYRCKLQFVTVKDAIIFYLSGLNALLTINQDEFAARVYTLLQKMQP